MDLPKGLVEDDRRIYAELADLPKLPIDLIIQFWRVYTTTNKKLFDPTAHRLEHFWWHIWGSDRRDLNPNTIAALWQSISSGPTVVPLTGSPNRYEPSPEHRSNSQHESDNLQGQLSPHIPETSKATKDQDTVKDLSASSSRPPPPHPILKKSRGDSKSGPRPTARFLSPPGSGGEEAGQSVEVSSDSTTSGGLEMHAASSASAAPTKAGKKKAGAPTKKFVASTASKRRPILPRRLSSQSSETSSENVGKTGGGSASSRGSQSGSGSLTANVVQGSTDNTNQEAPSAEATQPSEKALGKRPAYKAAPVQAATSLELGSTTHNNRFATEARRRSSEPRDLETLVEGKQSNHSNSTNAVDGSGEELAPEPAPTPARRTSAPVVGSDQIVAANTAPKMQRSSSNTESQRPHQSNISRTSSYGLLSNATASTSNVAALGQLSKINDVPDVAALRARGAFPTPTLGGYDGNDGDEDVHGTLQRNASSASLMMPTIPNPTPSVPLARSRSQLTLLLEREKERKGEKGW